MVSTERMLHLADLSKLHFNEAELERLLNLEKKGQCEDKEG